MENYLVMDIETQRLSTEVEGGWNNIGGFGVSVASVVFCYDTMEAWSSYIDGEVFPMEDWEKAGKFEDRIFEVEHLISALENTPLIITFNGIRFDYEVLRPYGLDPKLLYPKSYDILVEMQKVLGHRVSLASVAWATLEESKSGDGKDAVKWFKAGQIDKVIKYCKQDVEITRRIYKFIHTHGYCLYEDLQGSTRMCHLKKEHWGIGEMGHPEGFRDAPTLQRSSALPEGRRDE